MSALFFSSLQISLFYKIIFLPIIWILGYWQVFSADVEGLKGKVFIQFLGKMNISVSAVGISYPKCD